MIGSSLRSTSSSIGGVSGLRKSKSCSSCVIAYLTSVASFLHSTLFFPYRINGFFFRLNSSAKTPSVVRVRLSGFQLSDEELKMRVDSGRLQRSGLMTMKSAKNSVMLFTTSWSSASASRSRDDFLMILLKSACQSERPSHTLGRRRGYVRLSHTDMVLPILRLPELIDEELYTVRRRS